MDDNSVKRVALKHVLEQKAYLLTYVRRKPRPDWLPVGRRAATAAAVAAVTPAAPHAGVKRARP